MYNLSAWQSVQLNVTLENVPGTLGKVAKALSEQGVNILCMSQIAERTGGSATLRFVTDKQAEAKQVLGSLGYSAAEEEILVITCPQNNPGVIAAIAQSLAAAGINLDDIYYSSSMKQVDTVVCLQVGKDDLAKAMEIVKGL